jgi:purine-binding chemotaxis protein CheW
MNGELTENKFQALHLLVQNIYLCFPIQFIVKVFPLTELKPIPGSPDYCIGLINIEENSFPVIDLALRLNLHRQELYTLSTPIILCHIDGYTAGIIVDDILGLTLIDKTLLQMQDSFDHSDSPFMGVISINSRSTLLLNMKKILSINLTGFSYERTN